MGIRSLVGDASGKDKEPGIEKAKGKEAKSQLFLRLSTLLYAYQHKTPRKRRDGDGRPELLNFWGSFFTQLLTQKRRADSLVGAGPLVLSWSG